MSEIRKGPLVTVYVPTKNRAALLARALDSLQAQTHRNIEVIVVDDGSTDETAAVVERKRSEGLPIRYLQQEVSKGASAAKNAAIDAASGLFCTGLDDDDAFTPDRIDAFLSRYDDRFSFLCACVVEEGDSYRLPVCTSRQEIDAQSIRFRNLVGNQIFVRTERLKAVGGFDENLASSEDYDLWIRLVDRYGPALKLPLCSYVLNRSSNVARITGSEASFSAHARFLEKHRMTLTDDQVRHQIINDLHNRRVQIGMHQFFSLLRVGTASRLFTLLLRAYLPSLYRYLTLIHTRVVSISTQQARQ